MNNDANIILTQEDFQKLSSLILAANNETADALEEELGRAVIISSEDLPADVVAMDSKIKYLDLNTNKEMVCTLVYPNEADVEQNKISILSPVGSALIGLRVGQVISWPVPNGTERKLKIDAILFQKKSVLT